MASFYKKRSVMDLIFYKINRLIKNTTDEAASLETEDTTESTTEGMTESTTESTTEGGLVLDPEVINSVGDSTSSLEDIYGYPIFSEDFSKRITYVKEQETSETNIAFSNVFQGMQDNAVEDAFQIVMASDMEKVITVNYTKQEEEKENMVSMIGFTAIGMIATAMVFLLINKYRKKKRKDSNSCI